jgi:hypothetical protein
MLDKFYKRVLFVDPGLNGTGWAVFLDIGPVVTNAAPKPPKRTGVIRHNPADKPWELRAHEIAGRVKDLIEIFEIQKTVIEFPGLWTSGKSMASATTGDLFKLTYLIGAMGLFAETPLLISPQEWKGQLPKEIVIARIKKLWPAYQEKNHEADAVGMGFALQGFLNK